MSRVLRVAKYLLLGLGILVVLLLIIGAALSPFVAFEVRPSENLRIGVGGGAPAETSVEALPLANPEQPAGASEGGDGRERPARAETAGSEGAADEEDEEGESGDGEDWRRLEPGRFALIVTSRADNGAVAKAKVTIHRKVFGRMLGPVELEGVTDHDGRWSASGLANHVRLTVDATSQGFALVRVPVETGMIHKVALRRGGRVRVSVVDAAGSPATGLKIGYSQSDRWAFSFEDEDAPVQVDDRGQWVSPPLRPKRYTFFALASTQTLGAFASATVEVEADQEAAVTITLPPLVEWSVRLDGDWPDGCRVTLRRGVSSPWIEKQALDFGLPVTGRIARGRVVPGEYTVAVDGPGVENRTLYPVSTDTSLVVPAHPHRTEFRLLLKSGQPLPERKFRMSFEGPNGTHSGTRLCAADGRVTLYHSTTGTWKVHPYVDSTVEGLGVLRQLRATPLEFEVAGGRQSFDVPVLAPKDD